MTILKRNVTNKELYGVGWLILPHGIQCGETNLHLIWTKYRQAWRSEDRDCIGYPLCMGVRRSGLVNRGACEIFGVKTLIMILEMTSRSKG